MQVEGLFVIRRLAAIRRTWLLGLPIAVLCLVSIALSGMYASDLAGPKEPRFSYQYVARSFLASVLVIVSAATTWRVIRKPSVSVRFSWWSIIGILVGVLPASYYLWYTRVDPRFPVDFGVGVVSILAISGQLLLATLVWLRYRAGLTANDGLER